jgi:uncharacterized UPF0160 family protein
MKIVTHDSSFHTDDVFAVATLLLKFPDAEVVRTRDEGEIESADIVVDVGFLYDPQTMRFDHHQLGGAGKRENGIDYASFGLVWKHFGPELAGGNDIANIIDQRLAQPIDAHDNGIAIAEYKFDRVREYTIGDFIYSYLGKDVETPEDMYQAFLNSVTIAQELLTREITNAKEIINGQKIVQEIYENSSDKRLIELPSEDLPWRDVLGRLPEPLYIFYEGKDGKWRIKAIPDLNKPYGHNRKNLPESWAGLADQELITVTGVPDAIFAHRALFMAAAKSREGILELAKIALNQ